LNQALANVHQQNWQNNKQPIVKPERNDDGLSRSNNNLKNSTENYYNTANANKNRQDLVPINEQSRNNNLGNNSHINKSKNNTDNVDQNTNMTQTTEDQRVNAFNVLLPSNSSIRFCLV
jgi:hypothetical protein